MKHAAKLCTRCGHTEPERLAECSICGLPLVKVYTGSVLVTVATWAASHGWTNGRGNGKDRNGKASAARAVAELLGKDGAL